MKKKFNNDFAIISNKWNLKILDYILKNENYTGRLVQNKKTRISHKTHNIVRVAEDEWIKARLTGIVDRFKLTDIWKEGGITKPMEYAMLTNEIYKGWSGMKASEYKKLKCLRKESLRDNMTDIEVALTNIGEIATRDISRGEHPQGLKENLNVAKRGGGVAKGARDLYEKETKKFAISKDNALNYQYADEQPKIESNDYGEL